MTYIGYIQNGNRSGQYGGWSIDLDYIPSTTTELRAQIKIDKDPNNTDGQLTFGSVAGNGNFFRFFSYDPQYGMVFDCPDDSDARIEMPYTYDGTPIVWEMAALDNGNYYLKNWNSGDEYETTSECQRVFNGGFYVFGTDPINSTSAEGQKIYEIKIWEDGVLVKDYRPALDSGNTPCLYEVLGDTYHYNSGSGQLLYGGDPSPIDSYTYVEYIETDGDTWYDTGIIPDTGTSVEVDVEPFLSYTCDWSGIIGSQNADDSSDTYQIRRYAGDDTLEFKIGNTFQYVNTNYGERYNMHLDKDNAVVNGDTYPIGVVSLPTNNYTLYINAIHNPDFENDSYRAGASKFYSVKIWNGNTLQFDGKPAVNGFGQAGFYDEVSNQFFANLGNGEVTPGPEIVSISVEPEKTTVAATGETFSIEVYTEDTWEVSGNTWLTLDVSGYTGDYTITATAPDYSGSTNRTDTLIFTDTDTGDEVTLTIRQKKLSNGQPVYLGDFEISEMFLGTDTITEAYLGDVLVFSTGPFNGMKVTPTDLTFNPSRTSGSTKVKCSEAWEITSLPVWLSASTMSGDSGETIVTFENISQSADTADTITFESANFSEDVDVSYSEVAYNYIEGVRSSSAPYWDLSNHLDTGIYVTGDEDTRFRIKYYGAGVFSDRIVGFDATETGGDDNADFRYFPEMADAGEGRISGLNGWYNTNQYYDITFGNLFVYDNLNSTMVRDIGSFTGISTNVSIRIDMSVNWIKEVIIMREINGVWTDIADFKAAEDNGTYGMYDEIGDTFLTKNDLIGLSTPPSQS